MSGLLPRSPLPPPALLGVALALSVGCAGAGGDGDEGTDTDAGSTSTTSSPTDEGTASSPGTTGDGTADDESSGGSSDDGITGDGGDDGPWAYEEIDPDGRYMIDHLYLFTPQAVEEIEGMGQTVDEFIAGQLDDLNAALERSLVDGSRVRSLGYHLVTEEDFERTGTVPGPTLDNLGFLMGWLDDYRVTYGADKLMVVAGTAESGDGYNWGGGAASSYYVTFMAVNHEVGHTMGGSHCNDGAEGYNFGYPLRGYDAAGFPNEGGLEGGTAMCGNSIPFFSNPDLSFTLPEIADLVQQGLLPDQDYAAALGAGGTLTLGHPTRANMAQTWRDNEVGAATSVPVSRYPGYDDEFYESDDCAGFYAGNGYHNFLYELCAGEEDQPLGALAEVSSVRLGRNVHVNLYTDTEFGAGSTCGGIRERLAFSSPSLEALSLHHSLESIDDAIFSAMVYDPRDRQAHHRFEGSFDFYSSTGNPPFCATIDGEVLTVMRDGTTWSAAAAIHRDAFAPPYTIELEYRSAHEGETPPADALVVMFGKDGGAYEGADLSSGQLGFLTDGTGYGLMLNVWTNQVAVRDGAFQDVGAPIGMDPFTDGAWVPIRIEVSMDTVEVYYDGKLLLTRPIALDPAFDSVGLAAGTGAYASEFSVRGFSVTPGA